MKNIYNIVYRLILSIMLCFVPYSILANTTVKASLDSAYIIMGKQTTLHIEIIEDISTNGVLTINDAKISTIIDPIEIINRGPSDTIDLQNNRRQINQNIIIQSFDSGLYAIPPILYIANKDSFKSNELALKVIPVPVDSMATINGQACVLDPNTRWYDYLPDFITDYWGWILLAIIIILGAIFYYITRKKEVSILRAIGMSKKKLNRMLILEKLIIGFMSWIIGTGLGLLFTKIVLISILYFFEASMVVPWLAYLITGVVLMGIMLLLSMIMVLSMGKMKITESIRNND